MGLLGHRLTREHRLETRTPIAASSAPRPSGIRAAPRMETVSQPTEWWLMRLPGRIAFVLSAATSPLRLLAWLLDTAAAAVIVGLAATALAWWFHRISDDDVAWFLRELGNRGLSILGKSGFL